MNLHQMLHWTLPMGSVHQTYADVIFEAASHRLGRQVAAPQVLRGFDDEPESTAVPVASQPPPAASAATEAASLSGAGELSPPTPPSAPAPP